jgi:hypothetical protein
MGFPTCPCTNNWKSRDLLRLKRGHNQCWTGIWVNVWNQLSTPIMVSKTYPWVSTPIKYWYLAGFSGWEILYIPKVLIWAKTILNHIDTRAILRRCDGSWYIDPNGFGNTYTVKYPYPTGIKICEILIIDTQMVSKKDDTSPTSVVIWGPMLQT